MTQVIRRAVPLAAFLVVLAVGASAQDVLMNSAETINKGNLKLALFPTVLLGEHGGQDEWGVAGRAGVGLTRGFDVEAKAAVFDGLKYYGGDAEVWLVRGPQADFSAAVGYHWTDLEAGADSSGIDASAILSLHVAHRLELYGGLKLAFDKIKDSDQKHTLAHAVPGLEYRLSDDLDFLAEIGLALNDRSRSYASVGFALYFR
jgi:hypothetical protein